MIRKVLIIRDGRSDQNVLERLIRLCYQVNNRNHEELQFPNADSLNIINEISHFRKQLKLHPHTLAYRLPEYQAFEEPIHRVLFNAVHLLQQNSETSEHTPLLILYTDAEMVLKEKRHYFDYSYFGLVDALDHCVQRFIEKQLLYGYALADLPIIFPLVLFPSSEIIPAAAMELDGLRKLKALELKSKLYDTEEIISAFQKGTLQKCLDTYLTPNHLPHITREVIEIRKLYQLIAH